MATTKWEELEQYLMDRELLEQEFNSIALAQDLGVTPLYASSLIQSYLDAQRRYKSDTLFVLSRQGRTSNAVWHVGARTRDVRMLTIQCLSDITVKVTDALEPDLRRMSGLNPRAAKVASAYGDLFVANLKLLATNLDD